MDFKPFDTIACVTIRRVALACDAAIATRSTSPRAGRPTSRSPAGASSTSCLSPPDPPGPAVRRPMTAGPAPDASTPDTGKSDAANTSSIAATHAAQGYLTSFVSEPPDGLLRRCIDAKETPVRLELALLG